MKTTNTLTPIPLVPAVPAMLKALGYTIGAGAAIDALTDDDDTTTSQFSYNSVPTTWDFVKLTAPYVANQVWDTTTDAADFLARIPGEMGRGMLRSLDGRGYNTATIAEYTPKQYVHSGWNRVRGGYRYYDPTIGATTMTYIDPVTITGRRPTITYNPTASLTAEPTFKETPLQNTVSVPHIVTDQTVESRIGDALKAGWNTYKNGGGNASVPPVPPDDPEDKRSKIQKIWDTITAADKSWKSPYLPWKAFWWGAGKAMPTVGTGLTMEAMSDLMGWSKWNEGPTYQLLPVLRPMLDRWEAGRQPAPVVQPEPVESQEDQVTDEELQQIFNSVNNE